jgi:hypothetical protein
MRSFRIVVPALLLTALAPGRLPAAPQAAVEGLRLTVTAREYRLVFQRDRCAFTIELRDGPDRWVSVSRKGNDAEFAVSDASGVHSTQGAPARVGFTVVGDAVAVGVTTNLQGPGTTVARADFLCRDEGVLVRFTPGRGTGDDRATCWAMPRLWLDEDRFNAYTYWREPDELRSGTIAGLGTPEAFAGVSPWGQTGDTARRLAPAHPAVVARRQEGRTSLGVVLVDARERWDGAHTFLQRYNAGTLYFYPAITTTRAARRGAWAWLAPLPADPAEAAKTVERLAAAGPALTAGFRSVAPEPEEHWTRVLPDFPAGLRRPRPVDDIRRAIVYTINEPILSDEALALARKTGSDVLIRAWFKWGTAPEWSKLARLVPPAHAMGALFGGGITCSALYHGESSLTDKQVLAMATRGPAGQLVAAWGEPNCRHGSLSNHAYLEFLLDSCRRQVDAGVDVLFMDEINAALQADEGFDDDSIADFRRFLLDRQTGQGWTTADARWTSTYQVDLSNRAVAPDGTMATFHYRAYLAALGLSSSPHSEKNPLAASWHAFREARDDRAWKWLTDAIRAHAAAQGRRVLINANGLARHVDLQVLGVWGDWRVSGGRVDLSESQVEQWGSTVVSGWGLAGRKVPVVLFHDWGFGGFPWMEVTPDDRRLWMRVRGAEIYAAGGFFAFPVLGPMGNNARQDGTLAEVARQSAFYHRNESLYLDAELLGFEPLETDDPALSLALWRRTSPPGLLLHVINRQAVDGKLVARRSVAVRLPVERAPARVRVVSPDWEGERSGMARVHNGGLRVELPEFEAYAVVILDYDSVPAVATAGRRIVPSQQWARPALSEFVVERGGLVRDQWAVPGMLQGKLHSEMRNPPTFVVAMPRGGVLRFQVRSVAMLGARIQCSVDGRPGATIDLPDRDGRNDASAREYDRTFEVSVPPGQHRVTLDNVGGDWACISWYRFVGETEVVPGRSP